jgi:hypothetical protein
MIISPSILASHFTLISLSCFDGFDAGRFRLTYTAWFLLAALYDKYTCFFRFTRFRYFADTAIYCRVFISLEQYYFLLTLVRFHCFVVISASSKNFATLRLIVPMPATSEYTVYSAHFYVLASRRRSPLPNLRRRSIFISLINIIDTTASHFKPNIIAHISYFFD